MRGQDALAPLIVRRWALHAEIAGSDPAMVAAARQQANAMDAWQAEHGHKVPDLPGEKTDAQA